MLPRVNYLINEDSANGRYEHMGDNYDPEPKSTAQKKTSQSVKQQSTDNREKIREEGKDKLSKTSDTKTGKDKEKYKGTKRENERKSAKKPKNASDTVKKGMRLIMHLLLIFADIFFNIFRLNIKAGI